jgi:DNA polymerase III delta prime subunit
MGEFEALKKSLRPFVAILYERFGVEEARELIHRANLKREGESIYLVAAPAITTEAQQALLKLFEEPQAGVVFVLLLPHGVILPTLRSRMLEYKEKQKPAAGHLGSTQRDLHQTSAFLVELIKNDDKDAIRDYLNRLEIQLHPKIADPKVRQALEDIAMVRDYLRDRSPSIKMLLEHLTLSLSTL